MSKRTIKKIAVLGSGVMGSRIAAHFAGIGLQVLLLDMVPKELPADAKPAERNKIVNDALWSSHVGVLMLMLMDQAEDRVNLTAGECLYTTPSISIL